MRWPPRFNTDDYTAPGFPYVLQIEPTNRCNLSCPLCPAACDKNVLKRERRDMTLPEFKSIIDDMEEYLLLVILWIVGEPFMNPVLPEMIRYAAEKNIKTVTSTNAHFLKDTKYITRVLQSGLETLIVAVDSLNPDHYKVFRKGGSLTRVLHGLQNVVQLKNEVKSDTTIVWRSVATKQNEHELKHMRNRARHTGVDRFVIKTLNPNRLDGARDEDMIPDNPRYRRYIYKPGSYERVRVNAPCRRIWTISSIHSNGGVVPCCYDYDAQLKVGNVFETPFTEIWNGPAYRDLRKKIYHEKETIPKCWHCDNNYKPSQNWWFVESRDFTAGIGKRAVSAARQTAKKMLSVRVLRRDGRLSPQVSHPRTQV